MTHQMPNRYEHVFRPFKIGPVGVKNRIFIPAHTTNFAEQFLPTDVHVNYHRERAKGGAGLIIIECLRVHRTSLGRSGGLSGNDRAAIPGLRKITDVIHAENIPTFVQITHAGRHGENFIERLPAWGPSSIPWASSGEIPHAMTRGEIREVIDCYREAVEVALASGFDGMEIHFGHGHLLHQFLSPLSNQRTDEYGGSDENRMRFPMEVLRAVIDQLRGRAPLGVRLSVDELMAGGVDADASRHIAHLAAKEAGVSFINASIASYTWPSIGYHVADMSYPPHPYLDLTVRLRDAIGALPLLTANRYTNLGDAEEALATGAIDMVGMMRAHIADPEIIKKTLEGHEDRIRPCVSSNFCIEQLAVHRPITCMMNPRVGKEREWPARPPKAATAKTVLVVGGGPAGMEFARIAAQRGHRAVLWEKHKSLGGLLPLASTGVGRGDLGKMKQFLERELLESGARVECGREATVDAIQTFGADLVVVAAGADRAPVPVPELVNAMTATEALAADRNSWRGQSVLIVDQSGSWGTLSVAETLAASGASVSLISRSEVTLWDINLYSRMIAMERLRDRNVYILPRVTPLRVEDGVVTVREVSVGRESVLGSFSTIIVSDRGVSRLDLMNRLEEAGVPARSIGDADAPHALLQAMHSANAMARTI